MQANRSGMQCKGYFPVFPLQFLVGSTRFKEALLSSCERMWISVHEALGTGNPMLSFQSNLALFQISIGFGSFRETPCLGSKQQQLWGRAQMW